MMQSAGAAARGGTCPSVDEVQVELAEERAHEAGVGAGGILSPEVEVCLPRVVQEHAQRVLPGHHLRAPVA